MYPHYKRIIDTVLALIGLVVLALPMLLIALIIKLDSKGPVLFRQRRVGRGKKHFTIYKFRTMKTDAPKDAPTHLLQDARSHITRTGAFLRRTSLDELPQLFNILKGDMAVVGPRPALWNQADLIAEREQRGANNIRPGLTGLAQISGRDELPIPVKARLDGEYTAKYSLALDIKIIAATFWIALTGRGIK